MRKLLLVAAILFAGFLAKAQQIFFPTKEGTVLVYKSFDKKDKETGTVRYTITNIKSEGENMDITYLIESTDKNDEPVLKEEITIHKKGDKLYIDMGKFLNKSAFGEAGGLPDDIEITGNDMEIPSTLKLGDDLPDANIKMSLKMGFMSLKMEANVTDRTVEAVENIAVKAGNFEAFKLNSNVSVKAMGIKTKTKTSEWLTIDIGMIKSENYDKKGKLESYTELVEIR